MRRSIFSYRKNYGLQTEYEKGFQLNDLFPVNSVGIVTARDNFTIHHTPQSLKATMMEFLSIDDEAAREKFSLGEDVRDWKVSLARQDLEKNIFDEHNDKVVPIDYRPFDIRYTYYTGNSKGFHCMPRGNVMRHFLQGGNVGLTLCKQFKASEHYHHVFITKDIFESSLVSNKTSEIGYGFPLYSYHDPKQQNINGQLNREPNLNQDIVQSIANCLSLRFTPEKNRQRRQHLRPHRHAGLYLRSVALALVSGTIQRIPENRFPPCATSHRQKFIQKTGETRRRIARPAFDGKPSVGATGYRLSRQRRQHRIAAAIPAHRL